MVASLQTALAILAAALLAGLDSAHADNGLTANSVLIGQSAELTGQSGLREGTAGAEAYLSYVNKRGGVHGRSIRLLSYDDARDPKKTIANTLKLINEDKVFALFGYRSTPTVEAVLPVVTESRVPLIAPFSGAQSIREPFNKLVFHLRASYHAETGKIIEQLATVGVRKIAILYQDDPFGRDGLSGFEKHLRDYRIEPVAKAKYDRKDLNVDEAVKAIGSRAPEAVVMACTQKACADFIKKMKKAGLSPQFFTLSNVTSDEFTRSLGNEGRGVVMSQVMPYPWGTGLPLQKEFNQAIAEATPAVPVSYTSFEGFVAAKLLVEGLRRAGPNPTREKFIAALESMRDVDLGGLSVRFSPTQHAGSTFVELTIISANGKIMR
jgi:ABC-type branched-subunit amino acid transport system substrate-binding protein